jgi:hypothetical protein
MKELVKPTKLERQWQSTQLYDECGYNNCLYNGDSCSAVNNCGFNTKGCYDNSCSYNCETGGDDIIF